MKRYRILFWSILEWAVKFRWSLNFGVRFIWPFLCSLPSEEQLLWPQGRENLKPEASNPNSEKHNAVVWVFLRFSLSFVALFMPWTRLSFLCEAGADPQPRSALPAGRGARWISCGRSSPCLLHHCCSTAAPLLLGEGRNQGSGEQSAAGPWVWGRGAHPRCRSFERISAEPGLPALSGAAAGTAWLLDRPWENLTHGNGEVKGLK